MTYLAGAAPFDLAALRAAVAADHADVDPAHDLAHLDRVAATAARIARLLGTDPLRAQVAAYVHEYHRVLEARTGVRPIPVEQAQLLVGAVLTAHRVPRHWHAEVLAAVELTGRYRIAGDELTADVPVAAAVHDADNVDALGVTGLARACGYGALLGEPLWNPAADLTSYQDGATSSVIAHCYEKLVHLPGEMLTEPGRRLATERLAALLGPLGRLRAELDGPLAPGGQVWDPATGYLRWRGSQLRRTHRIELDARTRLGLDGEQRTVRVVELCGPQAAVGAAIGPTGGTAALRLAPGDPVTWRSGWATVEVEHSGTIVVGLTLHIAPCHAAEPVR
jgi:uncharacterized protein